MTTVKENSQNNKAPFVTRSEFTVGEDKYDVLSIHQDADGKITEKGITEAQLVAAGLDVAESVAFGVQLLQKTTEGSIVHVMGGGSLPLTLSVTGELPDREEIRKLAEGYESVKVLENGV